MRSTDSLGFVSNVQPGTTATVRIPVGKTIERLHLDLTNLAPADLSNIRLELNTDLVLEYKDGAQMESLNVAYFVRNKESNRLTFDFKQDDILKTVEEGRFFALGTQGLTTVQLKMDIASSVTDPRIEVFAETVVGTLPGWMLQNKRLHTSSSVAGTFEIDSFQIPAGAMIARLHIYKPEGDISKATFEIDRVKLFEAPKRIQNGILRDYGRAPQDNHFTIDWVLDGDMFHGVKMSKAIQDMRLKLELDSPGQVIVNIEYMAPYGAI
ncbi:major capsid protein P2 [Agarivorans sp. QJM3NY_25]|uniref:major capsid protein P2 n=1 Tax=Agarivorans sp. QJM3NY_25 TaxID=3421430 RepID=UPI003D7E5F4C